MTIALALLTIAVCYLLIKVVDLTMKIKEQRRNIDTHSEQIGDIKRKVSEVDRSFASKYLFMNQINTDRIKRIEEKLPRRKIRNGVKELQGSPKRKIRSGTEAKAKRAESGTVRIINPTGKNTGRKK